jgi:tetratricopeptide (TPR) repeat protein
MERGWQLDLAGYAAKGRVIRTITLATLSLIILVCLSSVGLPCQAQPTGQPDDFKARIRELFQQSRWQQVVQEIATHAGVDAKTDAKTHAETDADLEYYYGSALAQLGRWEDSRRALLAGRRLAPQDERFPVELAGVAFKQKRYAEAAAWLQRGLRINPADAYANNFLGTVYFLEGNLEAALKYWNRIGKPQINSERQEVPLHVRPELFDRALAFAPGSTLSLPELLTSKVRVEGLGIFSSPRIELAASDDGRFDAILNLHEHNGWGDGRWESLVSIFRGAAYETVYPEYFNIHASAINVTSLVRFDAQKRRLAAEVSGPLHANPKRRYLLGIDLRNENWAIRDSFTGPAPLLGSLNLRREVASAQVGSFESGRWDWSLGAELSHRDYRNVNPGTALSPGLLLEGMQLKQLSHIRYQLWRLPERRLVVSSDAALQVGRIWAQSGAAIGKVQGSTSAQWFPKSEGDDYQTQVSVRGGGTAGSVPFDELYMLGLERDNELPMRAHIGTRDGRKGSAPLGRQYFVVNSETDKNIYGNGLLSLKLSPFLDTGKITDSNSQLGSRTWLWDTGLQAKVRVLGVGLTVTWGKDLRTGNNAFYFIASR